MKKTKILIGMMVIILIVLLVEITFYVLTDIESVIPKEIQQICRIKQEEYKNRKVFIIRPKNRENSEKTILYFHGGSYMAEASQNHWEFISKVANDTGAIIIMPDYPLTPKNNYKDVFEMVEPFYKELIKKIDTEKLIIMGDSAGGGLALALEEKIEEENLEIPSKTILISPWLDVRLKNPEIDEYQEKDKELNKETLKLAGLVYAADGIESYLVNPIEGDLSKLKNINIYIGTNDILNPDVKLLKQKAEEQNVRKSNKNKRI